LDGTASGTIDSTTVAFNYDFFGAISGGNNNTYLSNTIISNNTEGNNGYTPNSCTGKFNFNGNQIFQWPEILPVSKWNESAQGWTCTTSKTGQQFQDPLLNAIGNNGCVGPTVTLQSGSPANGAGVACPTTPSFQPLTYFLSNRMPLDRQLLFTITVGGKVSAGVTIAPHFILVFLFTIWGFLYH